MLDYNQGIDVSSLYLCLLPSLDIKRAAISYCKEGSRLI